MNIVVFIKSYWLSLSWAATVLVLTLIPGKAIPDVPVFGIDKAVHFFLFGLLMLLMLLESNKQRIYKIGSRFTYLSFAFCISYGILIEFLQNFVPGRSSSIYDAIANTIGVVIGYLIFRILSKKVF